MLIRPSNHVIVMGNELCRSP